MSDEEIDMYVIKRNGSSEKLSYKKILERTKKIGERFENKINHSKLVSKIINQLHSNINTSEIDELLCQVCASMAASDYDYHTLASYLCISNHQKETNEDFVQNYRTIYNNDEGYLSKEFLDTIENHGDEFKQFINYENDYKIDYFGYKTLERAYLMKKDDKIVERVQHLWLRVAIQIHGNDIEKVKETYNALSDKLFIHATPTLFNSGTSRPQLSSCYLLGMEDDSIDGIFNTLHDCASISKWAGGIGLHIHDVRAKNTKIVGTNGTSNGLIPMLKVFNNTARYVDQGGGKRSGSFAMYLEPWHGDIEDFLELRKNHGDEEMRARDLFYALWIPDFFMEMVETDDYWYLMCPNKCPGLSDVYGDEFKTKYLKYVEENKYNKKLKARELWFQILDSQMETGTPYMLYKDSCNSKSNQKNLGMIKSSNLCTEIMEYSDKDETAVCNLASISLSSMVDETTKIFDYDKLEKITTIVTENLNKIIDKNFYPTPKTMKSNMSHRPIGIGVQGLADAFAKLDIPFDSDQAQSVNRDIFETIYYASLKKSNEISKQRNASVRSLQNDFVYDMFHDEKNPGYFQWFIEVFKNDYYNPLFEYFTFANKSAGQESIRNNIQKNYHEVKPTIREILGNTFYKAIEQFLEEQNKKYGHNINNYDSFDKSLEDILVQSQHNGSYSSFAGSPLSEGKFQFDLWDVDPSSRYDWTDLREEIMLYGVRNSLCVAPMPTASTSQILSNNECFEPFTSNIYSRRTLAGEFVVINKYLMKELKDLGIWTPEMKNDIIEQKGSIQKIEGIPEKIKEKYKIVWDMSMKRLIDMAKDRGAFICQSQSMNLWVEDPNYKNLTSMHFYAWRAGLKTGLYYLRRKAKHQAQQFTIEPKKQLSSKPSSENISQPQQDEACEMCSG
jgi:ribonucleotide reductase alpha subunit|tara:strand:- start:892 stop:3591 length:2700 start_codon:yes stop_codon:yes gene_type:complete